MACQSLALLVHLRKDPAWHVVSEYLLETTHHYALQKADLIDLTGDGVGELELESDIGGGGTEESFLHVFDLRHGTFEEVLQAVSGVYEYDDEYKQVLDIERTKESHGQQYCFAKTLFAVHGGERLKTPRITHPCYQRGFGVYPRLVKALNSLLAPLR